MPLPKENRTEKRITLRIGKTVTIIESLYKNKTVAIKKTTELKEQKESC